ncbi:glycosyltransferase family 2 protein [Microbacterium amylolyticum]|uniref:Glycosyltransferase 2-like domain-containing protein n=1 Tax=Microbacterium amylolyticum TaxID=936337 RepID=A0ABS4ZKU3_9MICO|nr:glycosyltransferase family 2 protein [Microbacterium amylolyticum]MBP2437565.1 hypothetical protein [Microbacterium amylolyticum]
MSDVSLTGALPLLSVVIPTHNVRPWMRQTFDSILSQRGDDMEVIVVDDRSTDGTREFAEQYALDDPRVSVISAASPGGGSARNAGAQRARGRYLIFADGDDLIPDGAYTALVESLERSDSDMAVGDYIKFRAIDTWRPTATMAAFSRPATGVTLRDEPTLLQSRPCWNRAFRRDFWKREGIEFPDVLRSNDIVPMVRALSAAESIDIIEDCVYVYRERPGIGSMTAKAGSATSLLSYLDQESECARMIARIGDEQLSRTYAYLVYDRDGWVAVQRYLLAWDGPSENDDVVAEAMTILIGLAPQAPARVTPLRRLALELVARGEFAAAHVVARVHGGDIQVASDHDRERIIDAWRQLMAVIPDMRPLAGREHHMLVERLARRLALPCPFELAQERRALLAEATEVLGERVRLFAADSWSEPADDEETIALRERVSGRIDAVRGGGLVVIEGTSALGEGEVRPALFDGEGSLIHASAQIIEPQSVTWSAGADGRSNWTAAFSSRSLPMHRPLTPLLVGPNEQALVVTAVPGGPLLPEYTSRDTFLYDVSERVVVIRRRRHWLPRAFRRALWIARDRLRGILRR